MRCGSDFFGDEIESLRRFDPADQRSTDRADAFTLMPASEALLDEETIKRFRSRYRETFGATATGDPLYEAISDGRRMSGMEHWLPLFEERLTTIFDHLGENDLIVRDGGVDQALAARRESIDDYYANRRKTMSGEAGSYRPLEPGALFLTETKKRRFGSADPSRIAFPEPESARILSSASTPPATSAGADATANVYEAVAEHVGKLCRSGHKVVLASYTKGARERLSGLLEDHGLKTQKLVDSWQEALGSKTLPALMVLPLDHGFTAPDVAVLTEQDMLGDRLVRRRKKRKGAAAFLPSLRRSRRAICVTTITASVATRAAVDTGRQGTARLLALEYMAAQQDLLSRSKNIDLRPAYGSESDGVALETGWAGRSGNGASRA